MCFSQLIRGLIEPRVSYNSCDRYFGLIEKERKLHEIINDPNHSIDIIKKSKKNYPKFEVTKMQTTDFVTSQELQQLIVNRKVDMHKEKINWLKIRSTKLNRENPFHLYIIYDDEKIREVSIAKKKFLRQISKMFNCRLFIRMAIP